MLMLPSFVFLGWISASVETECGFQHVEISVAIPLARRCRRFRPKNFGLNGVDIYSIRVPSITLDTHCIMAAVGPDGDAVSRWAACMYDGTDGP